MSGDRLRKRAQDLKDGEPMRTHLVERDFAIEILEWCADELDGNHSEESATPTTGDDQTERRGEA